MQPQKYERITDFTEREGDDTDHSALNDEFDAAALTTDQIRANLALIQRDDGALKNGIVTADALDDSAFDAVQASVNEATIEAQEAATSALTSATTANAAKDAAVVAKTQAETARDSSNLNAVNAAASAVTANTKAGEASASAAAALASEVAADASEAGALASKNAAATSETNALASKNAAATSETNALTYKNAAQASQTAAAASETSAAGSASSAANSAAAAAAALDNFDDRYLGSKASNPTLDNDGNALLVGALYYNNGTVVAENKGMWVYDGAQWIKASAAAVATMTTYEFVTTHGQSVLTGADANGVTLAYTAGNIAVVHNGSTLRPGDDYIATNGTSITLLFSTASNDELLILAFTSFSVADVQSSDVKFTQSGANAVLRNAQDKLREVVSVKDFGAVGNGIADDTAAIQAAMDAGRRVYLPAGTYKFSRLEFRNDNTVLFGDGQKRTYLSSTATSGSSLWNPDQATTTRYYCGVENLFIDSNTTDQIVDWRSMQFGFLRNLWVYGKTKTTQKGISLGTLTWGVTECTYNELDHIYIGAVAYGIHFYDGANTNTLRGIRVQPGASAYGYYLANATGAGRISNNTFISCHCEFPGNTVSGYTLGLGSEGTTIIGARLESLDTGINITADASNTTLVGCYFSSNIVNVDSQSTSLVQAQGGAVKVSALADYGHDGAYYAYNSKRNRFLHSFGGFEKWENNANNGVTKGIYSSTYAGGTTLGVGANGSYIVGYGGILGIGTTTANQVNFGVNGTRTQVIDTSGNFHPHTTNSVSCGKSGAVWTSVWATNATIQTSDEREKTDIKDVDLGLSFIKQLRPVIYKMKVGQNIVEAVKVGENEMGEPIIEEKVTPRPGMRTHYGLIAQELKQILGDKDASFWIEDQETGLQGIRYEGLISPLIKAVQELCAEVELLKTQLANVGS